MVLGPLIIIDMCALQKMRFPQICAGICWLVSALCWLGCGGDNPRQVVVYAALDREFSEPILEEFEKSEQIKVACKYDVESTKTLGLVEAITAEQARPRCDLFWNNEILNTIRLQRQGLLQTSLSTAGQAYPAFCQAKDGSWYGFAARMRILIVNTERLQPTDYPTSVRDLTNPRWAGRCGIAKPLFGTTATHAAVWWSSWGEQESHDYFQAALRNRVQVLSGNKQVATAVATGQIDWGLTDTDDALGQIAAGAPVAIIYPDQGPDQPGLLVIPNTLMIIKGGPNPEQAVQLRDWLLTSRIETKLCAGPSGQIPLHRDGQTQPRLKPLTELKVQSVDWELAADAWPAAMKALRIMLAE
jgi:iron(III) transport system substrate-binding protein